MKQDSSYMIWLLSKKVMEQRITSGIRLIVWEAVNSNHLENFANFFPSNSLSQCLAQKRCFLIQQFWNVEKPSTQYYKFRFRLAKKGNCNFFLFFASLLSVAVWSRTCHTKIDFPEEYLHQRFTFLWVWIVVKVIIKLQGYSWHGLLPLC